MKIGKFEISSNNMPFIIAEVGVNYDNDMELAEKLIVDAKEGGAHAVKFQTYTASKIVAIDSPKYWEDKKPDESQFEFFKRSNTFYHEETKKLAELCKKHDVLFMSTPFDLDSVDLLEDLNVPAYKIASADITNYPLLRKVAKTNKPIILSTGASDIGEIHEAVKVVKEVNSGTNDIVLLHCMLSYPTPANDANLKMIKNLRELFPDLEVGWSDHVIPDTSVIVPVISAVMGASVIEKHFTTDTSREGNDHFHSVDKELLKTMIKNIKIAKDSLGVELKQCMPVEVQARKFARRSIGVSKDLKQGDIIQEDDLIMLRPGTGIEPKNIPIVIGRTVKKNILKGHLLTWDHF